MTTSILYARALYDYDDASNANVLSLKEGDVITITEVREDGWWAGKLGEKVGYFPSNYVEVVPEPNSTSDSTASTTSAQPPSRGNIPVLPVKASAPTPLHTDGVHVEMQTFGRTPKPSKMSKISTQFSQEKKELADEPRGGHRSTSTESESTWISSPLTTAGAASTLALPGGGAVSPIAGEGRGRNHSRHAFGETSESTVYNNLSPKNNGKTSIVVGEAGAAVVDDEGKQKESWWTRDKKPRFTWIPCRRKGFVLSRAQYYALCCFFCGLFTMVFFLILIYAVMPAIIKSAVAGAQLQFTSITITNPQSNSLDLNANGLITNAGPFKAALDQMTMYVSEINADGTRNLLGTITLQPITIEGDTSISTQTQFAVLDQNAFNNFTRHLIFNNQVMWHLEASATVTPMLGSVKGPSFSNIPFSKDITLTACGGLLDVQLNTFNLSRSTPTDIIVDLAVMINNPSIFNIHPLGDLHFQMVYNGTKLGDVFATAASLSAGENILPMSGYLKPADPAVAGAVVNRYLTGSQTSVVAVADPVDGSSIPLYNLGMRGLSLNTVLNPYQGSLIGGMEFSALSLTPSANSLAVTFGGNLTMNIISPLGSNSPLIIQTMSMEANMTYAGQVIGALSIPTIPVAGVFPVQNGYKLNLTLTFAVDLVANMALFGDGTNYVKFVKTFLAANMLQIGISGKANTAVTYALGPLVVTGLPVVTTSNLAGLQNLNQTTVQSINVLGNRAGCGQTNCGLSVSIQASIFNPSVATVSVGPASMWLNYSNAIVGQATSSNLVLAPGANHLTLSGYINPSDPNNLPVIEQFLSNYLNGIPCLTYLQSALGTPLSNGLYADAKSLTLSALTLSTAVVQAPVQLLQAINIGAFQLGFQSNQALPITATSSVSVTMAMPSNLAAMPITVLTTSMAMTINAVINGVSMPMASLQIPVTGVTQTGTSPSYTLSLSFAALSMSIAAPGYAFSNFTELTVTQQSVQVEIFGTASATAQTGLGAITLTGIPAHSFVTIPALHNFFTPSSTTPTTFMTISSLDITSGDANGMYMNAAVTVNNPSSVVTLTNAGQVQLDMVFNPSTGVYVKLADVTVSNFQLTSTTSPTVLSATATLKEGSNPTATRLFLSNYMQQISQTPLILGSNTDFNGNPVYRAGTVQQYLVGAINALNSAAVLPGLGSVLIAHIYMLLTASSKACLNNPFSADIQITGFTNGVISINGGTLGGNQLATLNEQITFLLPAHSTNFISPTLSASLALTGIGSLSSLDMDVQLACKIGGANGYPTVVHIVQTAIPATLDIFSLPSTC